MKILRFASTMVYAAALIGAVVACGDDETSTSTSGTTSSGGGGMGTGGSGTGGSGTGGSGTGGMGTGGTGTGGMSAGGSGGGNAAAAFCGNYDTTCGFGATGRYASSDACTTYYDAASTACQTCITTHLGLAASDANTHCPHGCGSGPCAGDCGTSGCM